MFEPVANNVCFPELETQILQFWKEREIYEKSLQQRAGAPGFVFYEGPPTANGLPHPGHCLTRAIKDLFPRYRTMRGDLCERKSGWDTHGLPVEVEVCKELGIHSKEEIEAYGVEPFIHKCQESVFRYIRQWEQLTERLGFWIHLDDPYVTYHKSYVESVWWSLKNLFDRGLLYQGHKIVWWWAQGGTALSSGEVGQGYREVADPSVYVRFPLIDKPGVSLLVWTTTPWTLPGNQFAAVEPRLRYAQVMDAEEDEKLIIAEELVETIAGKVKRDLKIEETYQGDELIGLRYRPPFDYYVDRLGNATGRLKSGGSQHIAWRIVPADFVTTDSGTGVVHQAPAFGEVDYDLLIREHDQFVDNEGPALICSVAPDGKFTAETPSYEGRWVKDCDKEITRELRDRGLLYHQEQYLHDYPFCSRAEEDPLIQYPRKSWFIRTTEFKQRMQDNNQHIRWLPEHIRDGRFGNFLDTNVDWALSRERYWGTPLPIWVCEKTGKMEAVGSYDELLAKPGIAGTDVWKAAQQAKPELCEDLKVHKPYIDAITYDSPFADGAHMQRVPEVIDCWYDSGAMPFAQWGYPNVPGSRERFEAQFPANFISEALDQTRGWFYSLLAISTLMFGDDEQPDSDATQHDFPHPYSNCIVLGLMLAEWWESRDGKQRFLTDEEAHKELGDKFVKKVGKMSKQLRNYRAPQEIFDAYGADALRWYFFANQPPWTSIIYSERTIKESIPEFLLRFWNVYSFFIIYANIDGFDPGDLIEGEVGQLTADELAGGRGYRPVAERHRLNRWILSELHRTLATVVEKMDGYQNFEACAAINEFVDALSNWYVRRSRDLFWSGDTESVDKRDAYWTLYEVLLTTAKMVAPFVPFVAEAMWRNLAGVFGERTVESVHLCDYPTPDAALIDEDLSERMALGREIASLGRSARMNAKLKVRQPLAKVEVILTDDTHLEWLERFTGIVCEELNVKQADFTTEAEHYISYHVQPNFKRLGPRVGRLMPAVKKSLVSTDGGTLLRELRDNDRIVLTINGESVVLDNEDIEIRIKAKEGWTAAEGKRCVVVLSTELTPALIAEGLARDQVRVIQDRRKTMGCEFTDRIVVGIVTASKELREAIKANLEYVMCETLAVELKFAALPGTSGVDLKLGDAELTLYIKIVLNDA